MRHNLILGCICVFLETLLLVGGLIVGDIKLTPVIILLVAGLYFAGRHMDKHHD